MRHVVLSGKNAVLQSPLENFKIRKTICDTLFFWQVLKHGEEQPSDCKSSCPHYYSQIDGLGLRVYITYYVIRIKKHLHNQIEIIKIAWNRKEYESLHPYLVQLRAIFVWPWKKVSVSVHSLFHQPMDEKIKTWPLCFPAKESLIWRRHCSIGQSCCSMTSKRSIGWFLESSRAWSFFTWAFA